MDEIGFFSVEWSVLRFVTGLELLFFAFLSASF